MAQFFELHPDNPQARLCRQAVQILQNSGVLAMPTDSCYALVCRLDDKAAVERLRRIRSLDERQHFALLCSDLTQIASYAKVSNVQYRLLKAMLPGPYTFILEATREVPRRVSHPSKKSIGLRVPDHKLAQAILTEMGGPLIATTLQLPGQTEPMRDPEEIRQTLEKTIDLVLSTGAEGGHRATTVVDWTETVPRVVRIGAGSLTGALEPVEVDTMDPDGI
ncbi:MAG: L-threonylcarbamoyladenylate synthase [Burkholderiaceae bacterium]